MRSLTCAALERAGPNSSKPTRRRLLTTLNFERRKIFTYSAACFGAILCLISRECWLREAKRNFRLVRLFLFFCKRLASHKAHGQDTRRPPSCGPFQRHGGHCALRLLQRLDCSWDRSKVDPARKKTRDEGFFPCARGELWEMGWAPSKGAATSLHEALKMNRLGGRRNSVVLQRGCETACF